MYQTFAQTIFNRVYQVSTKIIPVCTHHAQAQPPEILNNHPKPKNTSSPNSSKNISAQHATFTVTHPSIPSQEGKPATQSPHFQDESCTPISPLERGPGVCHARALPPENQSGHPKPKKHDPTKQQQNHLTPTRASHHNTPLNPLSRGETSTPQITHYQ